MTGKDAMFITLVLQNIVSFLRFRNSLSAHGSKKLETKCYDYCSINGGRIHFFLHHLIFDFGSVPREVVNNFPHTPILLCRLR